MSEDASAIQYYRAVSNILTAVENRRLHSWELLEGFPLMQTAPEKENLRTGIFRASRIMCKVKLALNMFRYTCICKVKQSHYRSEEAVRVPGR